MDYVFEHTAADRALASIAGCLTADVARRVAEARVDDATLARIDDLAERNTEGLLTDAERAEYETYVSVIDVIALLQAKARVIQNGAAAA